MPDQHTPQTAAETTPPSAARVQAALDARGVAFRVVTMPSTTRTAQEAATTIGCTVAQIAKSIVFRGGQSGKPLLVIASGVNRIDERLLAAHVGEPLEKASAEFVRASTGFAIGGVPPIGFPQPVDTWIDRDLLQYGEVWAAAGTPYSVFCLDPQQPAVLTGGAVVQVA
jgi:prolyl-tRNA editing enzyme YbaK/EbsC (Cys-tRNA(Pro) deacylase)